MKKIWLAAIALGLTMGSPVISHADESFIVTIQKKQEEKKKSFWSLSEWLATKEKIRLMDMWLALHTPSPYEFQLGGYYLSGQPAGGTAYNGFSGHFTAMASLVGLELSGDTASPDHTSWSGLFNLRVFGYNEQGTHITFKVGLRNFFESTAYRNAFVGGEVGIPFNRFFGMEGSILRYFETTGGTGTLMSAYRYTGGLFIDFDFMRLRASAFYEPAIYTGAGASTTVVRQGMVAGTTLYF